MQKIIAFIIPILLLSGCLTSEKSVETQDTYIVQESGDNHSYQFVNIAPMSVSNVSTISFNETGELDFVLEMRAVFHEPLLWERGFVNYSLIHDNTTIFSVTLQDGLSTFHYLTVPNATGNFTVEIHSSGSDNQFDNSPGDYFVAKATFQLKW